MYPIIWNGHSVGNAEISKNGMFYRIRCRCEFADKGRYRVWVTDGKNAVDLGLCVPEGCIFSCVTRIPCKNFSSESFAFQIVGEDSKRWVPVSSGVPFGFLEQLNAARLQTTNGQPEIIIDPAPDQLDNGQNLKYLSR